MNIDEVVISLGMWWISNPSDLSDLQTRFLSDSDLIFVLVRLNFRKINYRKTGCDRWGRMEQFAHISEIDPLRSFSVRFKKSNLGYVSDDIQCSCFWHNKMGWNISLQLYRIFVFFFRFDGCVKLCIGNSTLRVTLATCEIHTPMRLSQSLYT